MTSSSTLLVVFLHQASHFHPFSTLPLSWKMKRGPITCSFRFPFKQVKCESSNKHQYHKNSTSGSRQQSCQMSILSYSALPNEPTQPNPAFANRTRRSTQSCCETSRRPVKDISGIWNSWNFPVIHAKSQNAFSKQYCIYWRPTFKSRIFRLPL